MLRATALKTLTLTLPLSKGAATFQCAARVCAAAHALKAMEPIVIALASNERCFPGLYCAVASALRYLEPTREVDLKVFDGGISQTSGDIHFSRCSWRNQELSPTLARIVENSLPP